ncbi:S8 family serine peptidase [bacterium]|nr:S8 family serine peptidase [bacterium]
MVKKQLLRIMLVFLFLFGSFFAPLKGTTLAAGSKHVIVYETNSALIETFKRSGFNILEVYDAFFLAEVSDEQETILQRKNISYVEIKDIFDIRYANYIFHPDAGKNLVYPEEVLKRITMPQDNQLGYFLLQFIGPVKAEWITEIETFDVDFYYPLPYSAYLVRTTPVVAQQLKSIRFVRGIGYVPPVLKASPDLLSGSLPNTISVSMNTTPDINLENFFEDMFIQPEQYYFSKTDKVGFLRIVDFPAMLIKAAYQHIDIVSMNLVPEKKVFNAEAAQVVEVRDAYDTTFSTLNEGDNQVVAVGDTGLSTGNITTLHPAFLDPNRVHAHFGYQSTPASSGDWADHPAPGDEHGTHVSGSVLGDGDGDVTSATRYKGMAPKAKLVIQSLKVPGSPRAINAPPYATLFGDAYGADARIHTNSWGGGNNAYTGDSAEIDSFLWNNKDFSVLFAAGNSGYTTSTLLEQANAKNCITVGATENNNHGGNPAVMAQFSSGGLTSDGRIKPDVVAPGQYIRSTVTDHRVSPPIHSYIEMRGTSMSTPITAGSLAVIREFFTNGTGADEIAHQTPSSALLKAALINGAFNEKLYTRSGTTLTQLYSPSRISGWGRVNVKNAVAPEGKEIKFYDRQGANSLYTGANSTPISFYIAPTAPLKVTLVWTDYPGSPNGTKALVNDLDLKVTNDKGQSFFGNAIDSSSGNSIVNPSTSMIDTINNVEVVNIQVPEEGVYQFVVYGTNIPAGPQPYALVITGGLHDAEYPPPVLNPQIRLSVSPSVRQVFKGAATSYNARVISYDGASGSINFSVQMLYNSLPVSPLDYGITYTINPLNPVLSAGGQAESVIDVTTSSNTPVGDYEFRVTAFTQTLVSNTVIVGMNVIMEPYFDFSFTPTNVYIQQDKSGFTMIDVSTFFGFSEDVLFEVDTLGLPEGLSFSLKPNPTTNLMKYQTKLTIDVSLEAPVGTYEIQVIGKNNTSSRNLTVFKHFILHVQKRVSIYKTQICMQSSPETVDEEGIVKYRIQIKNVGNEPLTNNTLIFELDPNLEFVFSDPAGSYASGELYIGIRDLAIGECYPASNCEAIKFPCISDIDGHYVIITAKVKPFRIKPDNGTILISKLTVFSNPFYTETFTVQTSLKTKQAAEYPLYFKVYFENLDDEGTIANGKELKVRFKIEGGTGNYTYNWDWNDGEKVLDKAAVSEEYLLTHTYTKPGVYRIKIEARDAKGRYKKGEVILRVK